MSLESRQKKPEILASLNPDVTIGANLRRLRTYKGMLLYELANAIPINRRTLGQIEKGERALQVSELVSLAIAFQVPASELVNALLENNVNSSR